MEQQLMSVVYVSTLALRRHSPAQIIALAKENRWPLEFSSGMEYAESMEEDYLKADLIRMPHNYFPAPAIPFVLNLASTDETIRTRSVQHCLNGLRLASQSAAPFFAAHAGFCIDPDPAQLGRKATDHFSNRE
jgi:hypothetical protein